jgi:hypothetical protein
LESDDPKIQEENRAVGSIDSSIYWAYIKAGAGPIFLTLTVSASIISQGIFHASDFWLTEWYVHFPTYTIVQFICQPIWATISTK